MRVYIESYGCTFNKADGQIIAGVLLENDIDIVDSMEDADVIIVNTCYVKLPTENKVVYKIQKLQETYPDKKIIVGGCMVEIDPEKLDKIGPDCSWIGPHQLNKAADVVKGAYCGDVIRECGFSKESKVGVPKVTDDSLIHHSDLRRLSGRMHILLHSICTRAFEQLSDCRYCCRGKRSY